MAKTNYANNVRTETESWIRALNALAAPCYPEHGDFTATGDLYVDTLARTAWHARWALEIGRCQTLRHHLTHLCQAENALGALTAAVSGTPRANNDEVYCVMSAVALARSVVFDEVKPRSYR